METLDILTSAIDKLNERLNDPGRNNGRGTTS